MEKKNFIIGQNSANLRIDVFLATQLRDHSRTSLKDLIINGFVSLNKKKTKPHCCLKLNDCIDIEIPPKKEISLIAENIPLEIIYEDEDLIVLNKQPGIVVHIGAGNFKSTLVNALLYHTKELSDINPQRPGIVHRLDKETSGLMVVAKNNFTHLELVKQFKVHSIKRRYIALVRGRVEFKEGVIDLPIHRHPLKRKSMSVSFNPDAKNAQTFYRVLKRFDNFTLLELFPKTGRTHQLRVHLAYLKHPILGDGKYGNKNEFPRLALHAKDLGFSHPRKGQFLEFTSSLPQEMRDVIGNIKV
ncbi:MAG: RluA family pseudouridine synthase [Candidatus Omnitrophica bacterium]|nr:RluA family pseudouridine synthase [Candidatus Omnitrophota bacterium]